MQHSLQSAIDLEPSTDWLGPQRVASADILTLTPRHFSLALRAKSELPPLSHQQQIREAILLIFRDPIPKECLRLWLLTDSEWQRALDWLDLSGLALYFLGRLEEQHLITLLPEQVLLRLRRNLAENTARTAALLADARDLHRSFLETGVAYATLKGFSLGSLSVPRLEHRVQLDFDFLVAESSASEAQRILESRGFTLRGSHKRSLEFAAYDQQPMTIRDLYKPMPHRWIEFHIEPDSSPILERVQMRRMHDICMPVLDPIDLFLGQGLHIYKHLRYESTRPSHLLEFRRQILARSGDLTFWREVRNRAQADPRHPVGLGVAILVIEHLMGPFAPPALARWTVDTLPDPVRLWVQICAHSAILASPPSTKLYLLLHQALASTAGSSPTSLRQALLPSRLPRIIAAGRPRNTRASRFKATARQLRFNLRRVRFHLVEGLRLLRYARRFRKALSRAAL